MRSSGAATRLRFPWRRRAAIPLGLLATAALAFSGVGAASAAKAPQPTLSQVEQQLSQLNSKSQQLDQQYDAAQSQLTAANQQLSTINNEIARYRSRYRSMRAQVAAIAVTAYKNGSLDSPEVLLTSNNPQTILNQASILQELSSSNNNQMKAFLSAARQLSGAQQQAKRVQSGKQQIVNKIKSEQAANNKLIAEQKKLQQQLTPAQVQTVGLGGSSGSGGGVSWAQAGSATSAQAAAAISYASAQIGCPYVFGGTGPCSAGFDCSGLTMQAYAAAGISIPRTSYEQMSELPAVSTTELEPGDILGFAGNSHVGIYVGNGMLIHAPQTGEDVQEVALSGWFSENLDGAVRP